MAKKMFNKSVVKKCGHCIYADSILSSKKVLCLKHGPMDYDDLCRKYEYNPLLREPEVPLKREGFKSEDFSL